MRLGPAFLAGVIGLACDSSRVKKDEGSLEPVTKPESSAPAAPTAPAAAPVVSAPSASASANPKAGAKTAYDARAMKLKPCMTLGKDGVLTGRNCPSGFIVYGPYAAVPADTLVEFSFEIEADDELSIYSELVSEKGKNVYLAQPDQKIPAGTRRRFAVRLHVFPQVTGFESRLVVRAPSPVNFKVHSLSLVVH
jgi:hypothetical protein